MAKPEWNTVWQGMLSPHISFQAGYLTIFVTIIGTTIAPWMQFYQQSAIVDKGIKASEYAYERIDVIIGSLFAVFVAAFIMIACGATLYQHGITITSAEDAAMALGPLAGDYAKILFALGLLNASLFSAAILPLSTAYSVCEAFGWESSLSRDFHEAPIFFGIYTALIALGAGIILLPVPSLIQAMLVSQTMNGLLLPVILVAMLVLINDRRLMGDFVNKRFFNLVAWATAVILVVLAIILLAVTFLPNWFA
jgi:Mn2+/Fe2+ NRAMP family transporter